MWAILSPKTVVFHLVLFFVGYTQVLFKIIVFGYTVKNIFNTYWNKSKFLFFNFVTKFLIQTIWFFLGWVSLPFLRGSFWKVEFRRIGNLLDLLRSIWGLGRFVGSVHWTSELPISPKLQTARRWTLQKKRNRSEAQLSELWSFLVKYFLFF